MSEHSLHTIKYKNKTYLRVIPGKRLFQSTMVHSVVNRGDVFAVCLEDGLLTILPGTAEVLKGKAVVWVQQDIEEVKEPVQGVLL